MTMSDTEKPEEAPIKENIEETIVDEQGHQEKPKKIPTVAKPHNKFAQYTTATNKFGGGNRFGSASGKRMGRAAQRGR